MTSQATVFIDRDGVVIHDAHHLHRLEQVQLLPGAALGLAELNRARVRTILITNQSVIARGLCSLAELDAIHDRLRALLEAEGAHLDAIYFCPHHPGPFPTGPRELQIECACRKPGIGLFERACREHSIDPARTAMVGDSSGDIEFARRAGMFSILVQTGKAGRDGRHPCNPDATVPDLRAATKVAIARFRDDGIRKG